jgi:hypothetical protein
MTSPVYSLTNIFYHTVTSIKMSCTRSLLARSSRLVFKFKNSALGCKPRCSLWLIHRFGKHYSCHPQSEYVWVGPANQQLTKGGVLRNYCKTSSLARLNHFCDMLTLMGLLYWLKALAYLDYWLSLLEGRWTSQAICPSRQERRWESLWLRALISGGP